MKILTYTLETLRKHVTVFALKAYLMKLSIGSYFLFSLKGKARQCYNRAIGKQQGDWGSLRSNFCLDFYPISQIIDLRVKVLTIKQESKESLASAWN